ncbi:MAG: hypothetical protein HYS25_02790 [Ignavibacteriales bacterium]|nr:hypothetical protein [Ignavibacteriales bacterium]
MEENFIPDYSKYDIDFLIDVYSRLDRINNPLKAQALDEELKKRFNLPPETQIDPNVVLSFINAYRGKKNKIRTELSKYEEMIKHGWIAGVVIGTISFLSWLLAMITKQTEIHGVEITVYSIVDIIFIFALSYGVFQKSRVCANIFAGYFILVKLIQIATVNLYAIIGLLIFSPFLVRAVIGTIKYHKINDDEIFEKALVWQKEQNN